MAHREIEHVHSAAGCVGQVLHIGCMPAYYIDEDNPDDPFQDDPWADFLNEDETPLFVGGGGGPGPGGPPGGHDTPGGGIGDVGGPPGPRPGGHDVPGGGVGDADPPGGRPDTPGGGVDDVPADDGGDPPPGGDPEFPGEDVGGGIPPGHVEQLPFSFRRTSDPDEYYTGDGEPTTPFLIPVGATGDAVRARTVLWVTAMHTDVGQPAPTYQDI